MRNAIIAIVILLIIEFTLCARGYFLFGVFYACIYGLIGLLFFYLLGRSFLSSKTYFTLMLTIFVIILFFLWKPGLLSNDLDGLIKLHRRRVEIFGKIREVVHSDLTTSQLQVSKRSGVKSENFLISGALESKEDLLKLRSRLLNVDSGLHSNNIEWNIDIANSHHTFAGRDSEVFRE